MIGFIALLLTGTLANHTASFPSALSGLPSPDGKHEVTNVDRDTADANGNWHELYLRIHSAKRVKLLSYGRHVDVLWSPSSRLLAVNDYEGSDWTRAFVFQLHGHRSRPTRVDIERLLKKTTTGTQLTLAGHRYVTAERWADDGGLILRVRGYGGDLRSAVDLSFSLDPATNRLTLLRSKIVGPN